MGVGHCVPGTDGTFQPLICRIVCGTVRVYVRVYMWRNVSQLLGTARDRQTL